MPASVTPIIHDPADTRPVLMPVMPAIGGESTVERMASPNGV